MMKNLFSIFSKWKRAPDPKRDAPWRGSPSIYEHIKSHIDPVTRRMRREGDTLPDEEKRRAADGISFAPGARDGVLVHHSVARADSKTAGVALWHVREISEFDDYEDKVALYTMLEDDTSPDFIDLVLDGLLESRIYPFPHAHDFALALAKSAPDRGPVKFGIALLGAMGIVDDQETISLLGLHDEFTLYSAVALTHLLEDSEPALWDLAKKVDGWGRIHLVERLAATDSPDIKEWLLCVGFRNRIMIEYLAFICAVAGDLKGALSAGEIDGGLLDATGEIIFALLQTGPAKNINDYADAAPVIESYLHLLESAAGSVQHFVTLTAIRDYLTNPAWDAHERESNGWTEANRFDAIRAATDLWQHPRWIPMVHEGLASSDESEFYLADLGARFLGIETWEVHWARLLQEPRQIHRWFPVMYRANAGNIGRILALAMRELPLEQVSTGAAEERGFGPEFVVHHCLDAVIQELGAFPAQGWPLIAAALKSPVVRNRYLALKALSLWGRDHWTAEIEAALEEARGAEPLDEMKDRIERVLKGEIVTQ